MLLESLVGGAAGAGALCSGAFVLARKKRRRLYGAFENRIAALERAGPDWFAPGALEAPRDFSQKLVSFEPLFAADCFARLRDEASRLVSSERNYVPGHKKGGTIAYETLIAHAPAIAGLYHSPVFLALASRIANAPLFPTPLNDQSSLSLLWYDRPGDHIGWHFDH
ncbi:MAG: hypothetical protein FJX29_02260, partial [Alphaproteobacteria bacterium]|nr:hypothetical protein [Alphaproteobacteria bacterium]